MEEQLLKKAMAAVYAAAPKAEQDPTRPVFHYRPPAQWMNDVCAAFFYEGWYHIFHQFSPWSDSYGSYYGWGHARSRDLLHWEFLPPALLPSPATGDKGVASGSAAFNAAGVPILFFAWTPIDFPERKRQQWAAVPEDEDLIRWRRVDIGLAPGKSGVPEDISPWWADMFVFRSGDRAFAIFKTSEGLICEAQNEDLTAWQVVGQLDGVDGECPNLFPLEDRYVLIRSTYPISYQVGDFDPEAMQFHAKGGKTYVMDYAYGMKKLGNHHRGIYGTTAFNDPEGRCILLGWVSGFKTERGWNGCMSLPRVLSLTDGHRLIQTPLPELAELRGRATGVENVVLRSETRHIPGVEGDTLEILAEIQPGDAPAWGLKLCGDENDEEPLVIRCADGYLNVAETAIPDLRFGDNGIVKLHIFLDRSVLEVFINDGLHSVTRVVYPGQRKLGIHVFADDGTAIIKSLKAWEIRSVW